MCSVYGVFIYHHFTAELGASVAFLVFFVIVYFTAKQMQLNSHRTGGVPGDDVFWCRAARLNKATILNYYGAEYFGPPEPAPLSHPLLQFYLSPVLSCRINLHVKGEGINPGDLWGFPTVNRILGLLLFLMV